MRKRGARIKAKQPGHFPSLTETLRVFEPLWNCLRSLRGEVYTVKGYPVEVDWQGRISRIDQLLLGWADCWQRIAPDLPNHLMHKLCKKLEHGVPVFEEELDAVEKLVRMQFDRFRKVPIPELKRHVRTEQIAIELELLGMKEAA